jgi:hypothetical protein
MIDMEDFDFVSEITFKKRLPRLFRLVADEGLRFGVGIDTWDFVSAKGIGDIIDVEYTNGEKDFYIEIKGGERLGYRILVSNLTDSIEDVDDLDIIADDQEW